MNHNVIVLFFLFCLVSCSNSPKSVETPKQYKYINNKPKEEYKQDSAKISKLLNTMLVQYNDFFYPYSPEYVDTTKSKVLIDTILCSSDNKKFFVLLIVESLKKEFRKSFDNEIKILKNVKIYDGIGVIAKRKDDSSIVILSYGTEVGNYESLIGCKRRLREIYFQEIPLHKQEHYNLYNIDDKRMWEEGMWNKF